MTDATERLSSRRLSERQKMKVTDCSFRLWFTVSSVICSCLLAGFPRFPPFRFVYILTTECLMEKTMETWAEMD